MPPLVAGTSGAAPREASEETDGRCRSPGASYAVVPRTVVPAGEAARSGLRRPRRPSLYAV